MTTNKNQCKSLAKEKNDNLWPILRQCKRTAIEGDTRCKQHGGHVLAKYA